MAEDERGVGQGAPVGRLDLEVAVVTGAARGIGAAIARRLAATGVRTVVVADLDEAAVAEVAEELRAAGHDARAAAVDVADPTAVLSLIREAEAAGALDLVVSNAGIGTGRGLDASVAAWHRAFDVNVLGHVHAAEAALPGMLARGRGTFVHTCSAAGLLTMIGDAPYTVTKHAAVAFAEWLAVTYGSRGIRVHALCPQGVDTDMLGQGAGTPVEAAVRLAGEILTPDDVAAAVVDGLHAGRFLILPHEEVATHVVRKAQDRDRWLGALQRVAATIDPVAAPPTS
jgi:NAD(P)-dependent dehydrogenase (short-subunit alcohol dehydrogenase family)